jgi:hypothetical protein
MPDEAPETLMKEDFRAIKYLDQRLAGNQPASAQAFSAVSTSSSIFLASPNNMRLLSL